MSDLVTITGARACTSYGEHVARELASSVATDKRVVVAGGAYGIEVASHQAALAAGGDTIAILANGVDRPYPVGHRDLLDRIADVGLLVSEVPPGAVPTRHRVWSLIDGLFSAGDATPRRSPDGNTSPDGPRRRQRS
ncbi:DNA-processing protein DprA [Microcella alkaliphila]|uniref:DNA-processing protein DprA n=1 Tax=Microcella alkaliphila TaxID=279828 RepID=UPI001E303871|nr:DNA-processing protein DprA [Microcella alkaliphila]